MIYRIQNEKLTVEVSDIGAELSSIKDNDGVEYLWQGNPDYWKSKAPVMFPICGRLFEGKYTYLGKEYSMPIHGIVRYAQFSLYEKSESSVTLRLVANEQTLIQYPFDFIFDVKLTLCDNRLIIKYKVENSQNSELIFGLGAHPGFNVPLGGEGEFDDYYLEFSEKCSPKRVDYSKTCFRTKNDKDYPLNEKNRIGLNHTLFDNDAIFLYDTAKSVKLASDKSSRSVTVDFEDMRYVGFWHAVKTDAPYICIEPWASSPSLDGIVDDFATKEDMFHLPPYGQMEIGYTIKIN